MNVATDPPPTEPAPAPDEETDEEKIYAILGENPFYDDRVDILVNCLVYELEDIGLAEDKQRELFRELRGVVDKYELMLPKAGKDAN